LAERKVLMTESDEDRFATMRPDHPDFEVIAASIRGLDEIVDEVGPDAFDFEGMIAAYIDPPSLTYLAIQRSMRAFGVETSSELVEMQEYVMRGAAIYNEAFLLGAGFQEDKMKEQER
jgi:hypothetical protein